jgi:lytic murein transglycosylase
LRYLAGTVVLAVMSLLLTSALSDAAAVDRREVERRFQAWLSEDVWPEAKGHGITRAVFDAALKGTTLDWSLPELEPPGAPVGSGLKQWQAEFTSPGAYFDESRISALVAEGRRQLIKWAKTLDALEKRYHVPRSIIVAIWGRESAFGQAKPQRGALRTLATEAFIGSRKQLFQQELLAALQILQAGDISADRMTSSWAGALGQPQLLPSHFLQYAVDFDGDGRRDIWGSVPDSLASIANDLSREGWQPGRGWGDEIVAGGVPCLLDGPEQGKTVAEWVHLGAKRIDGRPFPASETSLTRYLVMPAGGFGPAFLVTPNFYALKSYNNSDLYALYVGHLADRFGSDKPFVAHWRGVSGFTRGEVRAMQGRLQAIGHDVGNVDGLIGFKTRVAVGKWQARAGIPETCFPDAKLVQSIGTRG